MLKWRKLSSMPSSGSKLGDDDGLEDFVGFELDRSCLSLWPGRMFAASDMSLDI